MEPKISASNLPEEFTIKDPFDKDYLLSLPKEALVEMISRAHDEMVKLLKMYEGYICLKINLDTEREQLERMGL